MTTGEGRAGFRDNETAKGGTMSTTVDPVLDEVSPREAFDVLTTDPDTLLIDVRTQMEWETIGVPDMSQTSRPTVFVEWISGPGQPPNHRFVEQLLEQAGGELPSRMFFICRSGARSAAAAQVVAAMAGQAGRQVHCTNVAEGFEGSPAYGPESGWQARGLPCKGYEA